MIDTIQTWATVPEVHALAWALLHSVWQGAFLALAIWAGLRITARSEHRYLLACTGLAGLPVIIGLTYSWLLTRPGISTTVPMPLQRLTAGGAGLAEASSAWSVFEPVILLVWLTGIWFMTLRLVGGWLWLRRRLARGAPPPESAVATMAARLAARLGLRRPVRVAVSARVGSLLTYGWWRPVVVLPAAALNGLAPASLELLLAHEMIHIRRFDYLVNLLQAVIEALLFFNPFVWWLSKRIRTLREECCDDEVVSRFANPVGYARSLAALEELRHAGLALAASGGSLMKRIQRILGPARPGRMPIRWWAPALLATLTTLIMTVGFACDLGSPADAASPTATSDVEEINWSVFEGATRITYPDIVSAVSASPEVVRSYATDSGRPVFDFLRPGQARVTCKRKDLPDLILNIQVMATPSPENSLEVRLQVGQRLPLDQPGMQKISVGNPSVVDVVPVGQDGAEMLAKGPGKTKVLVKRKDLPALVYTVQVDPAD